MVRKPLLFLVSAQAIQDTCDIFGTIHAMDAARDPTPEIELVAIFEQV